VTGAGRLAGWCSMASLAAIVAHGADDFAHGLPARVGVSNTTYMWVFGLIAMGTALAAGVAISGARWGAVVVVLIGIAWAAGAAADHYQAFLSDPFRESFSSRLWVWLIVGLQGAAAMLGARGLMRRRGPAPLAPD
jgi:hypothetical protein